MHSQTSHSYRVDFDALDKLLDALGHATDAKKAACLGVGRTTYQRQRRGEHQPSPRLMGAIQARFPGVVQLVSHPTGPAGPRPSGPAGPRPKTEGGNA